MVESHILAEVWRGEFLECVHRGHIAICDAQGNIRASWGDPNTVVLPRSSCKMLQALPLIESGAAKEFGLKAEHLALACASHEGAAIHTDRVAKWLEHIGLSEQDLRCGGHMPKDENAVKALYCGDHCFDQTHNNCSGKHSGFLTLNKLLGAGSEYIEPDHAVQKAVKAVIEEMAMEDTQGYGIDGCSAPNFAVTLKGLARSMACMADPKGLGAVREAAAKDLVSAMIAYPELVAGEDCSCTDLIRATRGKAAVKTGADGVYIAILPEQGLGVALKIEDGAKRGAICAITAMLVRLGVVDANHPLVKARLFAEQRNCNNMLVGGIRPSDAIYMGGARI